MILWSGYGRLLRQTFAGRSKLPGCVSSGKSVNRLDNFSNAIANVESSHSSLGCEWTGVTCHASDRPRRFANARGKETRTAQLNPETVMKVAGAGTFWC